MSSPERLAPRARAVAPFHVMRLLGRARELEAAGRSILHLEVGEPDFPTPEPILAAARGVLADGRIHYTPAAGLPELRAHIAAYYGARYAAPVAPERVLVTPGASGALQLAFSALLEPGDAVLLSDPSYPCYRQILGLMGVEARAIPVGAEEDFQLDAAHAEAHWDERVRAVIVASPANPTGSVLAPEALADLHALCRARGAALIVDEIYQGLVYGVPDTSALALPPEGLYVINSFSKYFGMTGWRLGWIVAPEDSAPVLERLAQNLFIAANTPAQQAALAAFAPDTLAILEARRQQFERRRERLLAGLRPLGLEVRNRAAGAFYLYARLPDDLPLDAMGFASRLLEEAGVAITPGDDFGVHEASRHVRFAYTRPCDQLDAAVARLAGFLAAERR